MTGSAADRDDLVDDLVGGRTIVRNTMWNLVGQIAPVGAVLLAVPVLVRQLGSARFGVLSLIWVLIGYFNLFDLGFGRALTQMVAHRLGERRGEDVASLVWTFVYLTALVGVVVAAGVALASPVVVREVLNVPASLADESIDALLIMALSLPAAVATPGLRGVLEAHQRFDLVTMLRVPSSVALVLGPVAVLPVSDSLVAATASLAAVRVATWAAHAAVCVGLVPEARRPRGLQWPLLRQMAGHGGWMTVSNVVAPVMAYFDRFLIGALVSAAAVTYYATPFDVITRLSVVPLAVSGVLFPAFATSSRANPARTGRLFRQGTAATMVLMLPAAFVLAALASEALHVWLPEEVADQATPVLRILAVGVFVNSLAQVPFGFLQGVGRPDLTAKVHLVEAPLYLTALWLLTSAKGVEGAAIAWDLRVIADAAVLFVLAGRLLGPSGRGLRRLGFAGTAATAVVALGALVPGGGTTKVLVVVLSIPAWVYATWRFGIVREDRASLRAAVERKALA